MAGTGPTAEREATACNAHPVPDQCRTLVDWLYHHARCRPDSVVLAETGRSWTYRDLAEAVHRRATELRSPQARLISLEARPTGTFVVDYLATFAAGHAALVGQSLEPDVRRRFEPVLVLGSPDSGSPPAVGEAPPLHPDLALLLSTSGSTGSPKLVRLSHQNLSANASSIASYLDLTPDDATITSLPLSYCYGLSLLHSHLVAGATLVLTDASVVDAAFWDLVRHHDVSTLAGVPHSFELFERIGLGHLDLPALRRVTCAGGRLAPDRVVHWHAVGAARGWDLIVMYGQTEATARIAYLPPHLARLHPTAVGRPVPGGRLTIRPVEGSDDPDAGEVVYHGPNVMMGYAETRDDLSRPAELTELATGDLGRFIPGTDLLEIVGRARRFVKPMGVRVDLDQLEARLAQAGFTVACTGDDTVITIAVEADRSAPGRPEQRCHDEFARATGLPRGCVRVVSCPVIPRTVSGKIDHGAIAALGPGQAREAAPDGGGDATTPLDLRTMIGAILGVDDVAPGATFVDLGGDSLTYVEVSAHLEAVLLDVPREWHLTPLCELESLPRSPRSHRPRPARSVKSVPIDTTAALRAIGICAVVGTHMGVLQAQGGAHLMLAVAGYNFARFQLAATGRWGPFRSGLRTAARVGLPASLWIGANLAVTGRYSLGAVLLVNDYTGAANRTDGRWEYWYFEAFVKIVVAASLLVSVPALRRWEQRQPYGFALTVVAALLLLRYNVIDLGGHHNYLFRAHTVAWFFALGWLVFRSRTRWQRLMTAAVTAAVVPGFFHSPQREWFIVTGLVLLVAIGRLRLTRLAVIPLNLIAASSMWIFLVHWQVWPVVERLTSTAAAYPLVIASGCLVGVALTRIRRLARRPLDRVSTRVDRAPGVPSMVTS